jgi:adenylate cyclase
MAVWGVPYSIGNDTENAVNGALLMRRSLLEFNKGRGGPGKPTIKIGCGINTGSVIAGQIGSNERMEYTVIGDAVNLASRIESLNKPFRSDILLSQESYELVKDIFKVEPMKKITVKGKSAPQQVYAVLGRNDDPGVPENLDAVRRLIGYASGPLGEDVDPDAQEEKYEVLE